MYLVICGGNRGCWKYKCVGISGGTDKDDYFVHMFVAVY